MPFDFVLPDLGEGTTEGEIRKWVVKEGDTVEEHQTILEIETDKAVVEVPSPKKGKVLKIRKEEGSIVKVGEVLMTVAEEGEAVEEKPEAGLQRKWLRNTKRKRKRNQPLWSEFFRRKKRRSLQRRRYEPSQRNLQSTSKR